MKLKELKNTLANYSSRILQWENCIDKFEDKIQTNIDTKVKREKSYKNIENVRWLMNKYKKNNLQITEYQKVRERGRGRTSSGRYNS